MGGNTDEWVAGVASYVRTSFGNTGGLVTPADVARVRAADRGRARRRGRSPSSRRRCRALLDAQQWKVTASHNTATARLRCTLRGWTSGAPQAPGMWFQVELPQPAMVTEMQFESAAPAAAAVAGAARPERRPPPAPAVAVPARLLGAGLDGRQDVEQAGRRRQGRRCAHRPSRSRRRAPSSSASRRPTPSRTRRVVDQEPAHLRSARGGAASR